MSALSRSIKRKQKHADLRVEIQALSWEMKKLGPAANVVNSETYRTLSQKREALRFILDHT